MIQKATPPAVSKIVISACRGTKQIKETIFPKIWRMAQAIFCSFCNWHARQRVSRDQSDKVQAVPGEDQLPDNHVLTDSIQSGLICAERAWKTPLFRPMARNTAAKVLSKSKSQVLGRFDLNCQAGFAILSNSPN